MEKLSSSMAYGIGEFDDFIAKPREQDGRVCIKCIGHASSDMPVVDEGCNIVLHGTRSASVMGYCHCGHHVALSADRWRDDVRLSDIEPRFVCDGCGHRGAEVRPDFDRGDGRLAIMGHRTSTRE
ncbi:hypothetical protein NLM27_08905 [Bradyrhizobium sp. CCGB12]|uniref:hypothetical protein n=1 Tax=Bradyrhizobium sp. CCGB12 TaxID=2949632 RepID=UPI0020B3ECCE|nr:hypothetical protein [Bradyrhizobium sp. CCGB12]MCP3388891.1 hypothetical protein [Bradyrhizobium sp. CCGB12]